MIATEKKSRLVAHAASMGDKWPDSPRVGKTVEQNSMPAQRKMAMAIPPPAVFLVKLIPSGAARRTMMRQITGCAQRKCHHVLYIRTLLSGCCGWLRIQDSSSGMPRWVGSRPGRMICQGVSGKDRISLSKKYLFGMERR